MTQPQRISLADAVGTVDTPHVLLSANSDTLTDQSSPTLNDLTECVFFSPSDGRIWLNDSRMVLLHNSTLGNLRKELIDRLGKDMARGLLTRAGYASGERDARLVQQRWPDADCGSILAAGTRLHSLEGVVQVETLHFEFDPVQRIYDGEFLWHHSSEDDSHIAAYGVGNEPACWMQLGYAIGYVSTLLGKLTIFREVECRAMGHSACRVIGKTAEQWEDISEELHYLNADSFFVSRNIGSPVSVVSQSTQPTDLPKLEDRQLIGSSAAFNVATHLLQRVALTRATVLFIGESGVGKELFAQMLHELSPRKEQPFVSVNCAAIPETLIESELFGVERGAFTGATASRPGRFERAQGGTLFLDEIACLSLTSQGKLLRALQENVIDRVGGTKSIKVDVRIIAATNVDLREEIRQGRFREDLFFRLNVFPITIPPLRERRDDIPLLLNYFLGRYNQLHGRKVLGFSPHALRTLLNYRFPGNIRELQNLVERGVIAADDGTAIDLPHLFRDEVTSRELLFSVNHGGALVSDSGKAQPAPSLLEQFQQLGKESSCQSLDALEAQLVQEAVNKAAGNLSAAARLLGLTRARLVYRIKKLQQAAQEETGMRE